MVTNNENKTTLTNYISQNTKGKSFHVKVDVSIIIRDKDFIPIKYFKIWFI